jgi:hypothetical protein
MDEEEKGKVIMFPGVTRNRPPQSLDEICKSVALAKTTRIEGIAEIVIINLFEDLFSHGYDFSERPDTNKDMALLIEAMKSILNRHDGMGHPFHEMVEEIFLSDENGDLTLTKDDITEFGDGDTGC